MEFLYSLLNSAEFWAFIAIVLLALIGIWRAFAKSKGIPIATEDTVSQALEFSRDYALEKAEYLRKQQELKKEQKNIQSPQKVMDSNHTPELTTEISTPKQDEKTEDVEDEESH